MPSDIKTAAETANDPFKVFQAAQQCKGNVSAGLTDVLVEVLGDFAEEDVLVSAASSVIGLYAQEGEDEMSDFGKFAGELAIELAKCGSAGAAEKMKQAMEIYQAFADTDTDDSGCISKEEFAAFAVNFLEIPSEKDALEMFIRVDKDSNGVISFPEWLAFCTSEESSRAEDSFNCAGHHGLTSFETEDDGVGCEWCGKASDQGSKMFGCRRCDCDACLECVDSHFESCATCDRESPVLMCATIAGV